MIILVRNMAKFLRFLAWMKIWEIFYFGLTGRRARPPHSLAHTIKPFAWSMNENFLICFLFSHSLCLLFSFSPFDSCQSDWDCSSSSSGSRTKDLNVESVDCRFGSTTLDDDVDCNFNHTFIEFQSHDGSFISAGEETKAKDVVANASWTAAVSGECVDSSYIVRSSSRVTGEAKISFEFWNWKASEHSVCMEAVYMYAHTYFDLKYNKQEI